MIIHINSSMIRTGLILSFMILFLVGPLHSQEKKTQFDLELSTGIELGWWIYNRGSDVPGVLNNQGWDKSHYAPTVPLSVDLYYHFNRWRAGIGISYSLFFDNLMVAYDDSFIYDNEYPIAENAVQFLRENIQLELDLIQKKKFTLSPHFKGGIFQIWTSHPENNNLGKKSFWEFGISNQIHLSQFTFVIRPKFVAMQIQPKRAKFNHEEHFINTVGINFGIRYHIH